MKVKQQLILDLKKEVEEMINEIPKPPFYYKDQENIKIRDGTRFLTLQEVLTLLKKYEK